MRWPTMIGVIVAAVVHGMAITSSAVQTPAVLSVEDKVLREYAGVYQSGSNAFVYLQMWDEFAGFGKPPQLVAFD